MCGDLMSFQSGDKSLVPALINELSKIFDIQKEIVSLSSFDYMCVTRIYLQVLSSFPNAYWLHALPEEGLPEKCHPATLCTYQD